MPPWLIDGNAGNLWSIGGVNSYGGISGTGEAADHGSNGLASSADDRQLTNQQTSLSRRPILVAGEALSGILESVPNNRIPITTPKPTQSTTTIAAKLTNEDIHLGGGSIETSPSSGNLEQQTEKAIEFAGKCLDRL